jgi:hypothetical protein
MLDTAVFAITAVIGAGTGTDNLIVLIAWLH